MANYLGNLGFTKQPGAKYAVARNGLATYDVSYIGTPSGTLVFSQGNTSSDYPNTVLLDWSITGIDGCKLQIDLHYEGKDNSSPSAVIADQIVDAATATEPVDTSPKFAGIVSASGTPFEKIIDGKAVVIYPNGATFEKVSNRFLFFTTYLPDATGEPDFTTINPKSGMKNYKAPRLTFTESIIETSQPSLAMLGLIDSPPGAPSPPAGRNYLLDKIRSRNIANTYYEIQRTWLLSGPRGWDTDFYST